MIEIAVCRKYLPALLEGDGADQHGRAGNAGATTLVTHLCCFFVVRCPEKNVRKRAQVGSNSAELRCFADTRKQLLEWRPTFERVFRAPVRIGQGHNCCCCDAKSDAGAAKPKARPEYPPEPSQALPAPLCFVIVTRIKVDCSEGSQNSLLLVALDRLLECGGDALLFSFDDRRGFDHPR